MNTPIKILFLEDDELDRDAFLRIVQTKNLGYDLTVAETVAEARTHLAKSSFDIILADYHLPDGSSSELFKETVDTPFILLTGTIDEELALRTLERGADDYLPKDAQQRYLEAVPFTVEKAMRRKETQRELQRQHVNAEGINRLFGRALACETEEELSHVCLDVAEELTQSRTGFITLLNTEGRLEDIIISDPGWEGCKMGVVKGHGGRRLPTGGFEIHGIYGRVLKDGKGFFTNNPGAHPDKVGLPEGHPPLASFLGVPLFWGDRPVGMVALANRPGGYHQEQLRTLEALGPPIMQVLMRQRTEQELRVAKEELARANRDLEAKVERRTARLGEAMAELEHISYSMVHDMRAPLRAMHSFAILLEEERAGRMPPQGINYCGLIREAATRLDRLVTDALNYSRIVRQQLPVRPVEVGELIRGINATYPDLQPPTADITVEFEELTVLGNESLLTQCFGNLLGNAVKFVAPGVRPRVRVWAEERGVGRESGRAGERGASESENAPTLERPDARHVRIWVEDNGIGIPPEAREKIFGMFERMHRESEYPGTGIGLAIVKKSVQRMGGNVGFESEPGKGSKFWIELRQAAQGESRVPMEEAA